MFRSRFTYIRTPDLLMLRLPPPGQEQMVAHLPIIAVWQASAQHLISTLHKVQKEQQREELAAVLKEQPRENLQRDRAQNCQMSSGRQSRNGHRTAGGRLT
jgi:hypothetical protein